MAIQFELSAPTCSPAGQVVIFAAVFVCRGKRISEYCFVVDVSQCKAASSIEQHRPRHNTHTRAQSKQPTSFHRLRDSKSRGSAAGIRCCAGCTIAQIHATNITFNTKKEIPGLKVIASLSAAGKPIAARVLGANCCDCWNAG